MGRSQVKYNQRNGRPGQKGRGGPGRGNAGRGGDEQQPKQQQQTAHGDLGDNTWRYQQDAVATNESKLDEQLLALESHGNYANQVSAVDEDEHDHMGTSTVNVERMEQALLTVSLGEILRLPAYLTASLEEHSRRPTRKKQQAVVTEETNEETKSNMQSEKKPTIVEAVKEESEEEDDMESWLDSVIS
jgi:hypothetical protein